jgi:hypothetical protein
MRAKWVQVVKQIRKCDVSNADSLRAYRKFRAQAQELLKDDEDHSIWAQVVSLFWADATYRLFNEARRPATADKPNGAISPLLGPFIDDAYVASEVGSIGRLTDPAVDIPERGVVSLPTLLSLVRAHRHVITRENFVAYDGAPYDPSPSKAAARAAFRPGVRWVAREPWDDAEDRHVLFDRLSRKAPDKRKRGDIIHSKVLAACEQRLAIEPIRLVRKHRNKVMSHAADRASRNGLTRLKVSLASLDQAHRVLLEVAEVLSLVCRGEVLIGGPVAIPQGAHLEGIDLPFAFPEDMERLESEWQAHTTAREAWSDEALDSVLRG